MFRILRNRSVILIHLCDYLCVLCALCGELIITDGAEGRRMQINEITGAVVDAAIKVHSALGPGLLESAYEACLRHELAGRGLEIRAQAVLPTVSDGMKIDAGCRIALLVENAVIVEGKAVEGIAPIHAAHNPSYMKMAEQPVGCVLNFTVLPLS